MSSYPTRLRLVGYELILGGSASFDLARYRTRRQSTQQNSSSWPPLISYSAAPRRIWGETTRRSFVSWIAASCDISKILLGWAQIVLGFASYDLGSSSEDFGQIVLVARRNRSISTKINYSNLQYCLNTNIESGLGLETDWLVLSY